MISDENDLFRREIRIDSEATFLELNNFILDEVGYTRDEMTTFYVCDDEWQKGQEITLMDMGMSSEYDVYLMETTRLEEFLDERGARLLFVFDMLSERAFFLEVAELLPGESLDKPVVTHAQGKAPEQTSSIEMAELRSVGSTSSSIFDDDDLFGDGELDLDDLDPDGFTDLDSLEGY